MTEIVWGPEIAIDGKRPEWLEISDFPSGSQGFARTSWGWVGNRDRSYPIEKWAWSIITHIRLPADHPHYTAFKPHPAPSPSEVGPEVVERLIGAVRELAARDNGDGTVSIVGIQRTVQDAVELSALIGQLAERRAVKGLTTNETLSEPEAPVSKAQRDAVMQLAEAAAAMNVALDGRGWEDERRAIVDGLKAVRDAGVSLLEPVDADEAEVQFILHRWEENELETTEDAVREALKRGRALEKEAGR